MRYEPKNNVLEIDRFTAELIGDDMCFLYGDVLYSESAVRTIVSARGRESVLFFGSEKSICAVLCLLLLLPALLPVKAAAETAPAKVVRVGSFEDTFNYVNEKGVRKGYGYELLETLSGYTGWQFEYVTCDWSNCFEKLKNGEIDIMGDIS